MEIPEMFFYVLFVCLFGVMPFQLWLCAKVKSRLLRLLPLLVLSLLTVGFLLAAIFINGWDKLGYFLLAIFAGCLTLTVLLTWLGWIFFRARKERCPRSPEGS